MRRSLKTLALFVLLPGMFLMQAPASQQSRLAGLSMLACLPGAPQIMIFCSMVWTIFPWQAPR